MKTKLVTLSFMCSTVQKYSQPKDTEEHSYHNIQGNKQHTPHQNMVTQTEAYNIVKIPTNKEQTIAGTTSENGEEKRPTEQTEGMLQDGSEGRGPHYNSAVLHFSRNLPCGIQ